MSWKWNIMPIKVFDQVSSSSLEKRETELILLACAVIVALAGGVALLMYPVLFMPSGASVSKTLSSAFFGFIVLSVLMAGYLVERQYVIGRLRRQIEHDRAQAGQALVQANADLLRALPNFKSFQDRLPMELRRTAAGKTAMSVLVMLIKMDGAFSDPSQSIPAMGDAERAISRKLGEDDSVYALQSGAFGVILPGSDAIATQKIVGRISEGLMDAAGASNRFTFRIHSISYPEQTSSASDLELAIRGWLPEDNSWETARKEVLALR
jgi:hypothetical protein